MEKRSQLPESERPEKKAFNGQLRTMSDRDLLALFLGSGIAGTNVKQVAANVIRRFGGNLLTASPNDLRHVRGIGEVKAAKLAAAFELYRKLSNGNGSHQVRTLKDVQWLCHDIAREKQEILGFLALDVRERGPIIPVKEASLERLRKGCREKRLAAWLVWERTGVSQRWISERLKMGSASNVGHYVKSIRETKDAALLRLRKVVADRQE